MTAGERRRPVRVLHVVDSFDLGGAQEAILQMTTRCDPARYACEVAALHGRGFYREKFRAAGVRAHSLSPSKFLPLYLPVLAAMLPRFDIAHCHLIASNLIAKPLAALCGVPVRINHDHSNDSYRGAGGARMRLDRLANRFATHICAVSTSTRDFLVEHEKIDAARVSLVHNGTDPARFRPATSEERVAARRAFGLPETGIVIGGVGRLNYQKNFALFLEIAALLKGPHVSCSFVLAGDGPERAALEAQTHASGLTDSVHFTGLVADMTALYPAIDILVMPSRFEGMPLTLLEAMVSGIPAVASDVDGIAEIIEHGEDGLLAKSGEAEDFEEKIVGLLRDPERAREIGRAARVKVETRFSCESTTRVVERIYERYFP